MITQVTSENKVSYRRLWEEATADLRKYDSKGNIAAESGEAPIMASSKFGYAKVNITASTYEPKTFYCKTIQDGETIYKLDEGPNFVEGTEYYLQYETAIDSLNEYFAYIKELAMINPAKYTRLPIDEDLFEIDANARTIMVPASFAKNGISVKGDVISEIVYFRINRYFDMDDLSTKQIFVEWKNADGREGVSKVWGIDVESDPGYLIFGWPIDSAVTEATGKVSFSVRFYTVDSKNANTLQYSWSTLPQTADIKNSLDFNISGLISKNDSDVIRDNDTLIIDRLINSQTTEFDTIAEAPIFFDREEDEKGNPHNYGDLPKTLDMEDGNDNHNTLKVSAYSTDGGSISYRWIKRSYEPASFSEIVVTEEEYTPGTLYIKGEDGTFTQEKADSVFNADATYALPQYKAETIDKSDRSVKAMTLDSERETNKIYYIQSSKEGIVPVTYKILSPAIAIKAAEIDSPYFGYGVVDLPGDELNEVPVYETIATAVVNGIGRYNAVATNRSNKSTKDTLSTICIVAPPDIPLISTPVDTTAILKKDADYLTTIGVGVRGGRRGTPTYEWFYKGAEDEDFTAIPDSNKSTLNVQGAAYGSEPIGDGFYKVKITNHLNGATTETESTICTVTHEVIAPAIGNLTELVGDNTTIEYALSDIEAGKKVLDFELTENILEKPMKDAINKPEENSITYRWYKVYQGNKLDSQMDKLLKDAYDGKYIKPDAQDIANSPTENADGATFTPTASGFYFCVITNHFNGQSASISTPVYIVV